MKKHFYIAGIVAVCVLLLFVNMATPREVGTIAQKDNVKKSNNNNYEYSYTPPVRPPTIETVYIETFNLDPLFEEHNATYTITYTAKLAYNGHVGNNWGYGLKFDGEIIDSGCSIEATYTTFSPVTITAFATEFDSINDYGSEKVYLSDIDVGEKKSFDIDVIVRENRGRYSGNTAKWVFVITAERTS